MAVSMNTAVQAYRSAAQSALSSSSSSSEGMNALGGAEGGKGEFGDLVRDSLKKAVDLNRESEAMSLKGVAGEADIRDVVLAINNAEHALNTVVAVRDKVVTAYQEILRMPI